MKVRHWKGVGAVAALLAGGCAAQPATPPAQPKPNGLTPATPASTPAATPAAADRPQWEASGRPGQTPQALAAHAADYARAVPAGDATPTSGVQFNGPAVKPAAVAPPVPVSVVPPPPPAPVDPRAAVLGSAARTNPLSDMPQEVPESADFAPPPGSAAAEPLGRRLAKRAHEQPQDAAAQLDLDVYQQLNGDPAGAQLAADAQLPADERDAVAAVADGLSNFRNTLRTDPSAPLAQQIQPLQEMLDRLRSQADLTIGTVALCRRVDGFGRYVPIRPARFPANHPTDVLVYCEVENFDTVRSPDGQMWQTKLAQQVSIFNAAGGEVMDDTPLGIPDACRERRRDFSAYKRVTIPALPAGAYRLKVTVTDRAANKVAESDVPLSIG